MSDTIKIVFKGALLPGQTQAEVAPRLALALKIPLAQAQTLFSGQPVTLKRNLPRADFSRYAENLSRLGIVVEMEDETPVTPAPPPAAASDENLLFPSLFGAAPAATPTPAAKTPAPAQSSAPQAAAALAIAAEAELMNCPKCGAQQPKRTLCRECGVDMPRFATAQQTSTPVVATAANGLPVHASQIAPDIDPEDGAEDTPPFRSLSFTGRLCRIRYMAYTMGFGLLFGLCLGLLLALGLIRNMVGIGFFGALFLGYLIRLNTLRLHDMDRSGWWQLLAIPLAALQGFGAYKAMMGGSSLLFGISNVLMLIYTLWMIAWPGSAKGNRFGHPNEANTAFGYIGAVFFILALIGGGIGAKQERLPMQKAHKQEAAPALVTLYCNSSAAACYEARNWFSRYPQLQYEDCNIETTPSCRTEFDRLGGTVIPMLVVGNKKRDGFDEEWLQREITLEMMRRAQARQEQQDD